MLQCDGTVADIYISTYCDLKGGRSARSGGTLAYVPSLQIQWWSWNGAGYGLEGNLLINFSFCFLARLAAVEVLPKEQFSPSQLLLDWFHSYLPLVWSKEGGRNLLFVLLYVVMLWLRSAQRCFLLWPFALHTQHLGLGWKEAKNLVKRAAVSCNHSPCWSVAFVWLPCFF